MLKNLICWVLLSLAATCVLADGNLRIEAIAVSPDAVLTKETAAEGLIYEVPPWLKNENQRKRWLWVLSPKATGSEWREFSFSFRCNRVTRVQLSLRWMPGSKDGVPRYGVVRAITVNNVPLNQWEWAGGPQLRMKENAESVFPLTEAAGIQRQFQIAADQTVTVKGFYRAADAGEIAQPEIRSVSYQGWEMRHDVTAGTFVELKNGGKIFWSNRNGISPVSFRDAAGKPVELRYDQTSFDRSGGVLTMTGSTGAWRVTETLTFLSPSHMVRRAVLERTDQSAAKFRDFTYHFPLPPEGEYLYPGTFFYDNTQVFGDFSNVGQWPGARREQLRNLPTGNYWRSSHYVSLLLTDPGQIIFPRKWVEHFELAMKKQGDTVILNTQSSSSGWCDPGVPQEIPEVDIFAFPGKPLDDMLQNEVSGIFRSLNDLPPADRPTRARDMSIYAAQLYRFQLATFDEFRRNMVSRVKELGFNTVWFLPVQAGPVEYCPTDYYIPEPGMGGWEDYRAMITALRQNDICAIQDIVPHGGKVPASLINNVYGEEGFILNVRKMDFNAPEWNEYMAKVADFYSQMGIAGFRIDAIAGSSLPNWRRPGFPAAAPKIVQYPDRYHPPANNTRAVDPKEWEKLMAQYQAMPALPYARASLSQLAGGVRMSKTIRDAAKKVDPQNIILNEAQGFPFTATGDITYDLLTPQLIHKLRGYPSAEFVGLLRLWLDDQRFSDTPDALLMRYLSSHDYAVSTGLSGVLPGRALLAWCWFVRGVPQIFGGHDIGHGEFIKKLNFIRDHQSDLRSDKADYQIVKSSAPEVFTVLRNRTVIVINFSGESCRTELTLPESININYDLFHSRPAGRVLTLEPWGVAVLTDKALDIPEPLVKRPGGLLAVRREGNSWLIPEAYRYQINTVEGLIEDWHCYREWQTVEQRSVFKHGSENNPLTPNRIWSSRQNPLRPGCPEIRFFKADGTGMAIAFKGNPKMELYNAPNGFQLVLQDQVEMLQMRPVGERLQPDFSPVFDQNGLRCTFDGMDWVVENDFYRARISRTGGALRQLLDKQSGVVLLRRQEVTTAKKESTYFDFETNVELLPAKDGSLQLIFAAEPRTAQRLLQYPLEVETAYRFDREQPIQIVCRYRNSVGGNREPLRWFGELDPRLKFAVSGDPQAYKTEPGKGVVWGKIPTPPGEWQTIGISLFEERPRTAGAPVFPGADHPAGFDFCFYRAFYQDGVLQLYFPDPIWRKSLEPGVLTAGREYRLLLELRGNPSPVNVIVEYWNAAGEKQTETLNFDLPESADWLKRELIFTPRETGFAPVLTLIGKPEIKEHFEIRKAELE